VKELNPKTAVLTHMGHELEYNDLLSKLPDNIEPQLNFFPMAI